MNQWRTTASLGRAALVSTCGMALALLFGEPVLMVMAAPIALCAAMGFIHRPHSQPRVDVRLDHHALHEGQGTTSRLIVANSEEVEHVTRVSGHARHLALHPADGVAGALWDPDRGLDFEVSPRRWGQRRPATEKVGLTSAWGGWGWGPVSVIAPSIRTFPARVAFDSRAEMPQPLGLIGAHRSRRTGTGTDFAGIRDFRPGDRLRRINWPVSLRTGDLHVVTTRSEEDSAVLLVIDALADYGHSGGVDGKQSSLDLSVRAAAALAQHFGQTGDRVGLRIIGSTTPFVAYGNGQRHHQRILATLAGIRAGRPAPRDTERIQLGVAPGTVVILLSPMLDDSFPTLAATLMKRGLPTLVIDTLPADAHDRHRSGGTVTVDAAAWRMRRLERDLLLAKAATLGCPVIPWRGPGTLDEVIRRLTRARQSPQATRR